LKTAQNILSRFKLQKKGSKHLFFCSVDLSSGHYPWDEDVGDHEHTE